MNSIKNIIYISIGCSLIAAPPGFTASENLDELAARKARLATATWGKSVLENPSTLVWQPETLMYSDVVTGHEVWRLSSTKELKNSLPDISWSHWSADGKRFSFGSHRDTSAGVSEYETNNNSTYQGSVMMMRADGSYLRPADNAPFEVFVHSRYLHWSPTEPDVYYGFGRNFAGEGLGADDLFRVTVGDTSISKTKILDVGLGGEVALEKAMSGDGTKILAKGAGKYFPITLNGGTATLDDTDGWAMYRQLDNYWGNTPSAVSYTVHDQFLIGTGSNIKLYFIPEGYSSWWRFGMSGLAADGGPALTIDNTAPYNWRDAIEPVFTGNGSGGICAPTYRSPWNCDDDLSTGPEQYLSHPGFDRWGRYVAGTNSQMHQAWGVWDLQNHTWKAPKIPAVHYDWHTDWEAWSDYFVSSPSAIHPDKFIYSAKHDGTDTIQVASTHIRESGSTDYHSLPRATQSPDGTKVVYHSDFLYNTADKWDVFYAVVYYPHPPEITSVTGSSGIYTIRFDWRTNQTMSRGYTQRGWPHETTNDPPPPRETKKFRLWRSTTGIGNWEPISTIDADIFSRYNFASGTWKGNKYWEFTDTPGTGTWYYAITAMEHSGLESRTLSNVFSTAGTQTAAYPNDPKGLKKFYAIAPPWPELSTTQLPTPGQYRLDWKEPDNPVIRYYNIYYSNISTAKAIQNQRIASVPKGTDTYVDWLADPTTTGYYLITSVDTQGNESAFSSRGGITAKPN